MSDESRSLKDNCIFCDIIKENDPEKIIWQDDDVVVFYDIRPAAKFHALVVPKCHIRDAKSLKVGDSSLVEHMMEVATNCVTNIGKCQLDDSRFGYHWPPFHSVSHLHLHAIAPESEISFIGRLIFRKNSFWFVSNDYVLSRLQE